MTTFLEPFLPRPRFFHYIVYSFYRYSNNCRLFVLMQTLFRLLKATFFIIIFIIPLLSTLYIEHLSLLRKMTTFLEPFFYKKNFFKFVAVFGTFFLKMKTFLEPFFFK